MTRLSMNRKRLSHRVFLEPGLQELDANQSTWRWKAEFRRAHAGLLGEPEFNRCVFAVL